MSQPDARVLGVPSQLRERGRLGALPSRQGQIPGLGGRPSLDGWPGERWLDIRRIGVLAPIMKARIAKCARKGFDALEPDNINGYQNKSGFSLSGSDQLRYNRWFARQAHKRASRLHSRTTSAR
jgi:hypothetical protein